eukprot:Skav211591  [mRNA]  locus=scaffold2962:49773:53467:- [translate_table: standard]
MPNSEAIADCKEVYCLPDRWVWLKVKRERLWKTNLLAEAMLSPSQWLGRLVRHGASLASRSSLNCSPVPNLRRGFAAQVTSPRPLSIRGDGLVVLPAAPLGSCGWRRSQATTDAFMAQCIVAALVYFAASASPKVKQADAEAAVEEFKSKKGLEMVKVVKGRNTWYVTS